MDLTIFDNGRSGKGLCFVISSVSGGGKTTVVRALMEVLQDLDLCVSHTTRERRPGETPGVDYDFLSRDEFMVMIREDRFLEWAQVYGHYYGTSRQAVARIVEEGRDALLDIDVQGAMQVKEKKPDAVLIFLVPPGREEQERRLKARGTESPEQIRRRLEAGVEELAFIEEYHYSVRNDNLQEAVDTVRSIIKAHRCLNENQIPYRDNGRKEKE